MSREKAFISILMVLILIVLSGASVWAAPNGQDFIGVIVDGVQIDEGTDPATVLVTFHAEGEESQTVCVSVDTALLLGLVMEDPVTGDLTSIEIDPENPKTVDILEEYVIVVDEDGAEGEHPVALALAKFITYKLSLDDDLYKTIMGYHEEDGHGFGVIAQAWWMSVALTGEGDATLLGHILDAKKGEIEFSSIPLPDETEITATNWGQFRKEVVLGKGKNLGAIMSAPEELEQDETGGEVELGATSTQGNLKGKKDKAGGKRKIPPGQVKKSGKLDTPPGKVKNKDKGKGGGKKQ